MALPSHRRRPVVQMRCTHCQQLPSTYCEATSQGSKRGLWSLRRNHRLYNGSFFAGSDLQPPTQLGQAFLHAEDSYAEGPGLARLRHKPHGKTFASVADLKSDGL